MRRLFIILLFAISLAMLPVGTMAGPNNLENQPISVAEINSGNITSIQLELDNTEVEFGNQITVNFGFINSSDQYLKGVPFLFYLVRGVEKNFTFTEPDQNTHLLYNSSSTGVLEEYVIDTIPADIDPLRPGSYMVHLTTDFNTTNISKSQYFEVFPHEGAELNVVFENTQTNERIDNIANVNINTTYFFEMTVYNVGQGNALDVDIDVASNNPLLEFEFNTTNTEFSFPVISIDDPVSINFSVLMLDYGIGSLNFQLTFSNTLNVKKSGSANIFLHAIPTIEGSIFPEDRIYQEESTTFEVTLNNTSNTTISVNLQLRSTTFQFTPLERQVTSLTPGIYSDEFRGFSYQNGTSTVSLYMIFVDPLVEETAEIFLDEILVEINPTTVVRRSNILAIIAIVLYSLLLLGGVILYFRKDLRKLLLDRIIPLSMTADIDFKNSKVIVDGSNVAWEDLDENENPLIDNIVKAVETLKKFGFEEIIVVADAALRYQISNPTDLDKLSRSGIIKVLPAKVDGDSFILRLSRDLGALILTNDLYKEYRDDFPWIDERRIPYSILNGQLYLHPLFELTAD